MNFAEATNAHTDWKIRLRGAISEQSMLDLDTIARDDCCELGRWLHGPSRARYGALPAHGECVAAHARFHLRAADVAATINARSFAKAEQMLGAGSQYALASRAIVLAIEALRREIGAYDPALGDRADA
jgi:Chemoreceptor zinc-binding domain